MQKLAAWAMLLVVLGLSAGCATSNDWCLTNEPFRPANEAELQALSDATVEWGVQHNAYGQKVCGWKP